MKIIIDTDIGNDCDDAGALALMHNLKKKYDFDVLAIGSSTPYIEGAHSIKLINDYYKNNCLIGQNYIFKDNEKIRNDLYTMKLCEIENVDKSIKYETYVKALRKAYASSDEKVDLVILGPFNAMYDFLMSKGDEFSPYSGLELVNKKTSHIYIMGGTFANPLKFFAGGYIKSEWNIKSDIKSVQYFINNVNVEMTFIPFESGLFLTGKNLINNNNPVYKCYQIYSNGLRESWDLVTMYYAISKDESIFNKSAKGTISIDDEGVTTFTESTRGKHDYLLNKNDDLVKEVIDKYLY